MRVKTGSMISIPYSIELNDIPAFLAMHPLCRPCEQLGRTSPASIVDHVDGHRFSDWLVRFWDERRWQPCCGPCHAAKSARELAQAQGAGGATSSQSGAPDRVGSFARNTPMTLKATND